MPELNLAKLSHVIAKLDAVTTSLNTNVPQHGRCCLKVSPINALCATYHLVQ